MKEIQVQLSQSLQNFQNFLESQKYEPSPRPMRLGSHHGRTFSYNDNKAANSVGQDSKKKTEIVTTLALYTPPVPAMEFIKAQVEKGVSKGIIKLA